ncbi:MAG TPA: ABC transporter substrate-binding protein [Candidatus Binatia bacterium]|jgi:NitT/TauT family transport system substrate-binding protein
MGFTRREFIGKVTLAAAGLPLMSGSGWAQTKSKLGYMKIVDNAPMFVAMERGFFKAAGLELETLPMAGGAVIVQGVTSGDLQFGWTNVISLYQAHVEGFDFKFISGGATNVKGTNDTHALLVAKASPINSAKDLEGKTVAVNTLNNIVHLMVMAWIDKNGASSAKVKFVEVPFPQMEAALVAGKIDAASAQEPFPSAALAKGVARVLAHPWSDVIGKFLIASWFASDKWLQKNKPTAQAFITALNRGIDAVGTDPKTSREAIAKWTGLNPDLAGKIPLPVFEKGVSEKDLQVTIDLTRKYKLIPRAFKARDVISELAPKG